MKRFWTFFPVLAVFLAVAAQAQITVQIGNNYGYTSLSPFYSYYPDFYFGQLVLASDMFANGAPAGGGKVRAIAWHVTYTYGPNNPIPGMKFRMGHTANTQTNVAVNSPDKTEVWTGDHFPQSQQWNYIFFDKAFEWNGSDNLWIEACYDDPNSAYYSRKYGYVTYQYMYPNYATQWYIGNTPGINYCQGPPNLWAYPYRPDIRLEICNAPASEVSFDAPALLYLPASLPIDYSVGRTEGSFTATVTFNFYTPSGQFVESQQIMVPIASNTVSGTFAYPMTNIAPGFYKLEVVVNTMDECNEMSDIVMKKAVMVLSPGSTPCEVWPGDVNTDGIVNYGDRKDLNQYIYHAAMSPVWLQGPARYRADVDVNPLTYLTWEAQYSVPWQTSDGCHMDTDGNGAVNNFDYIAIKMNWNRSAGDITPKSDNGTALTFELAQNYPNPFNPSTTIEYRIPERSDVHLQVLDLFGREVATLVNGEVDAGVHQLEFDAANLSTGQYFARVQMSGLESGMTYSKTIKMTLSK